MKISLGPIYYYWDRQKVFDFYKVIAKTSVDIVYLGEVVCSKRRQLKINDWLMIANQLRDAGKEVVFSTLTLLEADSELKQLGRICQQEDYLIEANDYAAIGLRSKQNMPFVTGPSVNLYNAPSLNLLAKKGLVRWCFPLELSQEALQQMMAGISPELQTEVFVFGQMPLAFSARCFTARAYDLDKDDCQYKCLMHEDGLLLTTQEQQSFLMMNGIQTLSANTFNLISQMDQMQDMGVDVVRISPQFTNTAEIIQIFKDRIAQNISIHQALGLLQPFSAYQQCDGYWFNKPGMSGVELQQPILRG
ncbi:U32 family peptidase [Candidatus Thioglobus autotrophicus]|uniref:U32 family peptidase n=1 Tax=Candidatus Thioglobus autotrophicus TaxID=1705394 RepID=UPI00299D425A|nr:U32 family peptidase [Candidatus Thioglobus autotrophicus]WPE18007.1 U32 family peptidase [Candidatus Thioglobus autotrophicus]